MSARLRIRSARATRAVLAGSVLAAAFLACAVAPAQALRVTTWNILNYPGLILSTRQPNFRTVMNALDTDILMVQELHSEAGADSFLINVLDVVQPGQWARSGYFSAAEGVAFYKPAKVTLTAQFALGLGGPRSALLVRFRPVEFSSSAASLRIYSVHLKAGATASDLATRLVECTNLRNHLNTVTDHFMVGGDFNMQSSSEAAFIKLGEDQPDNDGRCFDPIFAIGTWHNNPGFASIHTQSPCLSCISGGFTGGGMDDRFDLWLTPATMLDNEGFNYVSGGYTAYGNDGQHYNTDINGGGFNNAVGLTVATALHDAADHLPVIITIQIPAKIVADSQLDIGDAIEGGTASALFSIGNGSSTPADELNYSFGAVSGFTVPVGGYTVQAGLPAALHPIFLQTSSVGEKSGTMTITCDDPDSSSKPVQLSGRVLRHADPSLDSLVANPAGTVQFGAHPTGDFSDMDVRVHNLGYDDLQARLSLDEAEFTGSSRFSIVGGFTPGLIAGTARTLSIHFDDTGAPPDSNYSATLTLRSSDESLPGAIAQGDLTLTLYAHVVVSAADVPADLPTALHFYPPRPNPTHAGAGFAFDLPRAASVTLDLHDLSGRRIGTLASGAWAAGHHTVTWSGRDDQGRRVPAGLYFARFSTPGYSSIVRVVVLP